MHRHSLIIMLIVASGCGREAAKTCNDNFYKPLTPHEIHISDPARAFLRKINPYKIFLTPDGNAFLFPDTARNLFLLKDTTFSHPEKSLSCGQLPEHSGLYRAGNHILEYDKQQQRGVFLSERNGKLEKSPDTVSYAISIPPAYYNMDKNSVLLVQQGERYFFLLNYGIQKRGVNINFLDTCVFYYVSANNELRKLGKYPASFFRTFLPQRETHFVADTSGHIYYVHARYDSVYKINMNGDVLKRNAIHKCPKQKKYGETDLTNLTYLREYKALTEENVSLLLTADQYIIVLKKLAQQSVTEKPLHKYFVYDRDLQLISSDTVRGIVYPKLFPLKRGFFLVTEKVDKILEYEIY